MSDRWPGWRTLPGIEIAPLAEKAREQGEPWKQYSYVWPKHQRWVATCGWQVDADGTVSIPWDPNWEPVTEDGYLRGFRRADEEEISEELVQITGVVVPEGTPPWSPAFTVRLPPDQIGMFRRGDSMADGVDIDDHEPHASLAITIAGDDNSVTQVVWGLTRESAASVIALIRERHGAPLAEGLVAPDGAEAFHDAVLDVMDKHLLGFWTREEAQ